MYFFIFQFSETFLLKILFVSLYVYFLLKLLCIKKELTDFTVNPAHEPEEKMKHVLDVYAEVLDLKRARCSKLMGMAYNTFMDNVRGSINIKVDVIMRIVNALFPFVETEIFPDKPKEVAKELSRNELAARLFAAALNDNKERMLAVAQLLTDLAEERLMELDELLEVSRKAKNVS